MALVMLPCDLPWWPTIVHHLTQIATAKTSKDLINPMQRIHNLCNVGLDPDETDAPDLEVFEGLSKYLDEEMTEEERSIFFDHTLPNIVQSALDLKRLRPPNGLHFSLQQQVDKVEFEREFVTSLLAHCFFSTFPKRTSKTHPTLQDFNCTYFFRYLHLNWQKVKLLSLLHYFNIINKHTHHKKIVLSRQVMLGTHWLTIEDWSQCKLPLCPLLIRRNGDINCVGSDHMIVCGSSSRLGGKVLSDGKSMECIQLITCPEMLIILLCVEALEDNEVIILEGVLQISRISDPKGKASIEKLTDPNPLTFCCMDPDDFSTLPILQYQQDSILRELNKALLGFRQKQPTNNLLPRRLSPIGESFSSTPEKDHSSKKTELPVKQSDHLLVSRRFIVLGSSGECLPITRIPSRYSSCHSTSPDLETEYHSARTSFTEEESENAAVRRYSCNLEKCERRSIFADRLKEALNRAEVASTESEISDLSLCKTYLKIHELEQKICCYIFSIWSNQHPYNSTTQRRNTNRLLIKLIALHHYTGRPSIMNKYDREGSCGFVLDGESQKNESFNEKLQKHRSASSKYSFSTDYSSELEHVYEQLGRWLDEDKTIQDMDIKAIRDKAVRQFAGNLLKRTLSESFVGIPVTDGFQEEEIPAKNIKIAARSLSLELARHRNKLAAQLVSIVLNQNDDLMPLATFNWGCSSKKGDPQLKLLIQWLAASVALLPHILYFTATNAELNKLDTVCRVLLDRQWSVGELVTALLKYCENKIFQQEDTDCLSLFEQIIGMEEKLSYVYEDLSP